MNKAINMSVQYFDDRAEISLVCISLSISIFAIRYQEVIPLLISFLILLWFGVIRRSLVGAGCLTVALTFLYPGPQIGWLYIRGAHVAAFTTRKIMDNGWPVESGLIRRSQPETPLIHIHAIMSGQITSLPILPQTKGLALISSILPLLYALICLLVVFSMVCNFKKRYSVPLSPLGLMFPVLLWAPFYWTKPAFNRQSLGFLMFLCYSFVLYRSIIDQYDERYFAILIVFAIATITSHHYASLMILVLSIVLYITDVFYTMEFSRRLRISLAIISVFVVFWWILFFKGGGLVVILLNSIAGVFSPQTALKVPQTVGYPIDTDIYSTAKNLVTDLLYSAVIGMGIIIAWFTKYRNNIWVRFSFIFGLFFAIWLPLSWIADLNSIDRIITFYVFVGGWVAPLGYSVINEKVTDIPIMNIVVILLIVISSFMIPLHIVSDQNPQYNRGETDMRYSAHFYASAEFLSTYSSSLAIIGDENIEHIVGYKTGKIINVDVSWLKNSKVPRGKLLVLTDYNEQYYFGVSLKYSSIHIQPNPSSYHITTTKNRLIYSNGKIEVHHR